jgi:hypothetical protein
MNTLVVQDDIWKSVHHAEGSHYNTFKVHLEHGMHALRQIFPNGEANPLNFVLFSTSGIHGSYASIEEVEKEWHYAIQEANDNWPMPLTFLIVQPRLVCLRYGNCIPETEDDFKFLKRLRETSRKVVQNIG